MTEYPTISFWGIKSCSFLFLMFLYFHYDFYIKSQRNSLFDVLFCLILVCRGKTKMLGLEVFVFCLLFGTLAHSQTTQCIGECLQNIVMIPHLYQSFNLPVSFLQGGKTVP